MIITATFACLFAMRLWTLDSPQVAPRNTDTVDVRSKKESLGAAMKATSISNNPQDMNTNKTFPKNSSPFNQQRPATTTATAGFQKRYSNTPFIQGYKPTGGGLPTENADFLQSERMWKYVSDKCLEEDEQAAAMPNWQRRAPYAILLGAMKVRGARKIAEYF